MAAELYAVVAQLFPAAVKGRVIAHFSAEIELLRKLYSHALRSVRNGNVLLDLKIAVGDLYLIFSGRKLDAQPPVAGYRNLA